MPHSYRLLKKLVASLAFTTTVWAGFVVTERPAVAESPAASKAAQYVLAKQSSSGAFFTADYPAYKVAETVAALRSAGISGSQIDSALAYVGKQGPASADKAGRAGLIVLGLLSAGKDPTAFGGTDYVARIKSRYNPATGIYDDTNFYSNELAMLAIAATKEPVPSQAITYARAGQCSSGGYSHMAGCLGKPDTDTTSMTICALTAAGVRRDDPSVSKGRGFLSSLQSEDGGFPHSAGDKTNSNSTGLALSALACVGEDPGADPWRKSGGATGITALERLAHSSGGIRYSADQTQPNNDATVQSIPGLMGSPYPVVSKPNKADPVSEGKAGESKPQPFVFFDPEPTAGFSTPTVTAVPGEAPAATGTAVSAEAKRPSAADEDLGKTKGLWIVAVIALGIATTLHVEARWATASRWIAAIRRHG